MEGHIPSRKIKIPKPGIGDIPSEESDLKN
jgi:hypothetical protein